MQYNYDYKPETYISLIENLEEYQIIEIVNTYLEDDMKKIYSIDDDFEDFCDKYLSYTEVANAVHDGDFRTWDTYFRYDGDEFTSSDVIDGVYDFTYDENFIKWLCSGEIDLAKYGITNETIFNEFCLAYDLDKVKVENHPNWDESCLFNSDWDTILEELDIEENDVTLYPEDED